MEHMTDDERRLPQRQKFTNEDHAANSTSPLPSPLVAPVSTPKILPFIVCGIAALFLFYEFVLQVLPSVMTTHFMRDFQVDSFTLGAVMAMFYYAYAPMQLFSGLSFDRFGARATLTLAILICALGIGLFGLAPNVYIVGVGRFLIGIGAACAFVGVLFLGKRWFAPQHFFLVAGITQLMGCLGAIGGETPTALSIDQLGWRSTLLILAAIGFSLALLSWLLVRDNPTSPPSNSELSDRGLSSAIDDLKPTFSTIWKNLGLLLRFKQAWWTGLYALMVFAPVSIFAILWGVPYLSQAYGLTTQIAGTACAMIWLGAGLGSPFLGWVSEKMQLRRPALSYSALLGLLSSLIILYTHLPLDWLFVMLFLFGIGASGQAISFTVVSDNTPKDRVGTAFGFNNLLIVLSGAFFQPLVGLILKLNWQGQMQNGAPLYHAQDYEAALLIIPICYGIGFLISHFLIKETYCRLRVIF